MDREFAELFDRYFLEAFGKEGLGQIAPLRTIPVNKSIDQLWPVAPYEDVKGMFKNKDKIGVSKVYMPGTAGTLGQGVR